jgi:hypothetical protein
MTDKMTLIERLRNPQYAGVLGLSTGPQLDLAVTIDVMRQAADEIERLQRRPAMKFLMPLMQDNPSGELTSFELIIPNGTSSGFAITLKLGIGLGLRQLEIVSDLINSFINELRDDRSPSPEAIECRRLLVKQLNDA